MKTLIGLALALTLLQACNHSSEKKIVESPKPTKDTASFFPVTSYILGQITEINNKGVNPLRYITIKGHRDSSFLKMEELPDAFSEFMHPVIDSVNLISLFTEKRFMDQTVDAFTFTYDPIGVLPDSMVLQHWDVYVEPKTGKLRRIYMVKNFGETKTRQLTWQGDKWCMIVDILNKPDGTSSVEKEVKITWDF